MQPLLLLMGGLRHLIVLILFYMSTTYTVDSNYKDWVKVNPSVGHFILQGRVPLEELYDFMSAFENFRFESIDISNFTIEIDGKNYEECYDVLWEEFCGNVVFADAISSFQKVLFNKEFATWFRWEKGFLLSDAGTVVIDSEAKDFIEIPSCVTVIGHMAFAYMENVSGFKLPDALHTIGHYAFLDTEIPEVFIPDSVVRIGDGSFQGCDLEKIHIPSNLETLPFACFEYNYMERVELPAGLKHIEAEAFMGNYLDRIEVPEGVESIDYNAFSGGWCRYIKLPSTLKTLAKDFYYEECIEDPKSCVPYIEVHPNNPYFFAKNGTIYSKEDPQHPYLGYPYVKLADDAEPNPDGDCSHCSCHRDYTKEEIDSFFAQILKEAEAGDAEKQNVVACMYMSDNWIEHDYGKAFSWAVKAAEQGSVDAMENLADAYYLGTWLEQDYAKAVEWLQKAVALGSGRAMNNLATCYEEGQGVEKNLDEALRLYMSAVDNGYDAAKDVERLRSALK